MSEKLKPCPFCGGEAEAYKDGGHWWVQCAAGGDCPGIHGERSAAVFAWNRRTPGPATRKVIEKLAADLDCEGRLDLAGFKSIGTGLSSWFSRDDIRAFIAEHDSA